MADVTENVCTNHHVTTHDVSELDEHELQMDCCQFQLVDVVLCHRATCPLHPCGITTLQALALASILLQLEKLSTFRKLEPELFLDLFPFVVSGCWP